MLFSPVTCTIPPPQWPLPEMTLMVTFPKVGLVIFCSLDGQLLAFARGVDYKILLIYAPTYSSLSHQTYVIVQSRKYIKTSVSNLWCFQECTCTGWCAHRNQIGTKLEILYLFYHPGIVTGLSMRFMTWMIMIPACQSFSLAPLQRTQNHGELTHHIMVALLEKIPPPQNCILL